MSIFMCATCDKYCDADHVGCEADNNNNLHCEDCLTDMHWTDLERLGFKDLADEAYKAEMDLDHGNPWSGEQAAFARAAKLGGYVK